MCEEGGKRWIKRLRRRRICVKRERDRGQCNTMFTRGPLLSPRRTKGSQFQISLSLSLHPPLRSRASGQQTFPCCFLLPLSPSKSSVAREATFSSSSFVFSSSSSLSWEFGAEFFAAFVERIGCCCCCFCPFADPICSLSLFPSSSMCWKVIQAHNLGGRRRGSERRRRRTILLFAFACVFFFSFVCATYSTFFY